MDARDDAARSAFERLARYAVGLNPHVRMAQIGERPALALGEDPLAAFVEGSMAFRLTDGAHHEAWQLEGARLWDPTEQADAPPQSEWVLVPPEQAIRWPPFIDEAIAYAYARAQAAR